jgi:hypothetical protein
VVVPTFGDFVDLWGFSFFSFFSLYSFFSGFAGDSGFFRMPFLAAFAIESSSFA